MSEQASLFLLSIGLLGEYCPSQRKKDRISGPQIDCMHFSYQGHNPSSQDCQLTRPADFLWNSYNLEGATLSDQYTSIPY